MPVLIKSTMNPKCVGRMGHQINSMSKTTKHMISDIHELVKKKKGQSGKSDICLILSNKLVIFF